MSGNQELNRKNDDEVDLTDLFSRLVRSAGKGLNALVKGVLFIFFFLIKNWLVLTGSLVSGIVISFVIKVSAEKFYTSDITLRSNTVPTTEMISYINRLHTFCKEGNFQELASALSVDPEKVQQIKDIKAFWIIDLGNDNIPDHIDLRESHDVLDTINVRMQDRFIIRVKTLIPRELSSIRDGIIHYAEKNQFYLDQNELRLRQADDMLTRIDYEVDQLDSLQKVKYFEESRRLMPKEGGQMIFLQDYQTQLLHNDIAELIRQKQQLETVKTIYADLITVLNDFTPPFKPENGTLYYGKVIIPVIFLLALIIILLVRNRNRLTEAYNNY